MNGKTFKHYLKASNLLEDIIKNYALQLKRSYTGPQLISCDCELSRINAVKRVWPNANILVCFHVTKNI